MRDEIERHERKLSRRVALGTFAALAMLGVGCAGREKADGPPVSPTAGMGTILKGAKRRLRKHVGDRRRRAAALELLKKIEAELVGLNRVTHDWRTDQALLTSAERGDRAQLVALSEQAHDRILDALRTAADHAVAMRAHLDAREWVLVFPGPEAAAA